MMPTRHGKIARLPLAIREELNRRLQNGDLSPALLPWLNQLPEVNFVLAQSFASQPISRQNLSEWRLGGYRDWLKLQERQLLIRRIAEEGLTLKQQEGEDDFFESFARIAAAELFADFDALDDFQGDERSKRLHALIRELAHLQREYNRSRQVELSWEKWNAQSEGPSQLKTWTSKYPLEPCSPPAAPDENAPQANSVCAPHEPTTPATSASLSSPKGGVGRTEEPLRVQGDNSASQPTVKVDQTASNEPAKLPLETVDRAIYHRRCGRGCVCPDCHPEDGIYPYSQAVKDDRVYEDHSSPSWIRGNLRFWVTHFDCDCYCDCDKTHPFKLPEPIPNAVQPQPL
jgi:hypothetical protein